MNGYLLTVIGTVIFSSVLTAILPDGKTSGVVKGVAKLALVLVIVSPILQFFQNGDFGEDFLGENFSKSVIQTDERYIQYYSEMRINETEKALENELLKTFGIKTQVCLNWSSENEIVQGVYTVDSVKINRIQVVTDGKQNGEVVKSVWEYLTKNYCSEVLIE